MSTLPKRHSSDIENIGRTLIAKTDISEKSDYEKRGFLEKVVSALRCKGRRASIAFEYPNAVFVSKGTLALTVKNACWEKSQTL